MDNQRLKRIMQTPGRATMDDVRWLCEMLSLLRADYAEAVARAVKAEEDLEHLTRRLAAANHKAAAYADQVLRD